MGKPVAQPAPAVGYGALPRYRRAGVHRPQRGTRYADALRGRRRPLDRRRGAHQGAAAPPRARRAHRERGVHAQGQQVQGRALLRRPLRRGGPAPLRCRASRGGTRRGAAPPAPGQVRNARASQAPGLARSGCRHRFGQGPRGHRPLVEGWAGPLRGQGCPASALLRGGRREHIFNRLSPSSLGKGDPRDGANGLSPRAMSKEWEHDAQERLACRPAAGRVCATGRGDPQWAQAQPRRHHHRARHQRPLVLRRQADVLRRPGGCPALEALLRQSPVPRHPLCSRPRRRRAGEHAGRPGRQPCARQQRDDHRHRTRPRRRRQGALLRPADRGADHPDQGHPQPARRAARQHQGPQRRGPAHVPVRRQRLQDQDGPGRQFPLGPASGRPRRAAAPDRAPHARPAPAAITVMRRLLRRSGPWAITAAAGQVLP